MFIQLLLFLATSHISLPKYYPLSLVVVKVCYTGFFYWISFQCSTIYGPLLSSKEVFSGFLEMVMAKGMWLQTKGSCSLESQITPLPGYAAGRLLFIESFAEKITFSYINKFPLFFFFTCSYNIELK